MKQSQKKKTKGETALVENNVLTIFASKGPNLQSRSKITRPYRLSAGVVTSVFFGQILEHDGILESSTSWYVIHSVI